MVVQVRLGRDKWGLQHIYILLDILTFQLVKCKNVFANIPLHYFLLYSLTMKYNQARICNKKNWIHLHHFQHILDIFIYCRKFIT
jgi:hypothetical protein